MTDLRPYELCTAAVFIDVKNEGFGSFEKLVIRFVKYRY